MSKSNGISGAQVRAILEAHGFGCRRQKGGHMIMQFPSGGPTIPVPDHQEIARGTLRDIITQSGLAWSQFELPP